MRRFRWLVVPALFGAWANSVSAQNDGGRPAAKPAAPKADLPPDPRLAARMEALLKDWEKQSAETDTLEARFTRLDVSQAWGDRTEFEGWAVLKSPDLACLNFDQVVDKKKSFYQRYICDGQKVYQVIGSRKQIFVFPLDPKQRQRALDEGPLPFLFNMKAEEAKARYRFVLRQEKAQECLIDITPLLAVDRAEFSRATMVLDKKQFLPSRLILWDPNNGKDRKDFTFQSIKRNAVVNEKLFDGETQTETLVKKSKWDRVDNPDAKGRPPAQARQAGPRVRQGAVGRGPQPAPR
jgi:TIGR03009 family protein